LCRLIAHQLPPLHRALNLTAGPAGLVIISILAHPRVLLISVHFTEGTYTLLLWYLFTSQLIILPSRPPYFISKLTCPAPHVKSVADGAQILVQIFGATGPPDIDKLSNIDGKKNRLPTAGGASCAGGGIPIGAGAGNNKPAGVGATAGGVAIPPEAAGNVEPAGATIGGAGARGRIPIGAGAGNNKPAGVGATAGGVAIPPEAAGNVEPAGATIGGAGARGRGKAAAA
jgi:hypothetical protein